MGNKHVVEDCGPVEGTVIDFTAMVDQTVEVEPDEPQILFEGDYVIHVPAGQKATVTYSIVEEPKDVEYNPNS